MKVLDLRCANGHGFEGWFASDDDYMAQNGRALVACPLCNDQVISRMPSAPRLNLSGARAPRAAQPAPAGANSQTSLHGPNAPSGSPGSPGSSGPPSPSPPSIGSQVVPGDLQSQWLRGVRELMAKTEDVGPRFPEEARRIHYGESPQRGIRGQATPEERAALQDEGIETMAIPVPVALKGPLQ
jgi:hypothetical protein